MQIDPKWVENARTAARALERMYAASAPAGIDTKLSIGWTEENPLVLAEYGSTGIAVVLLRTKSREHAKEAALALREALAKPDEEHRCGTCANNDPDVTVCGWQMRCRAGIQVPFSIDQADDGPPWPNCRFWRKR
jgi:hypothetical protein